MDLFGIGAGELLLILVVALIIWGPGKLPEIARTMGKMVRTLKKTTFDLTNELTKEMDAGKKELLSPSKQNNDPKPKNRPMQVKRRVRRKKDQPGGLEKPKR